MKKGWEYKSLNDLCSIVGRIGFRGYTKEDLVSNPDDGAITLSPSNIVDGELVFSKCSYINWKKYEESPEIMLKSGDVVLVKTASIGKCAVVRNLPHKATLNPQFVVLKDLKVNPEFITYYLKTPSTQSQIVKMAGGVAIPTLSQKKLGTLNIPVPPLSEQKEIVEYLDSSFAKIDKLKENAAKNLEEAKALFQSALKDALEPKEEWEEKTLIKEFSLKSGDNLSAKKQIKGPYDVYGGNGVTGSHIEYNLSGKNILIGRVGALCGNIHFVNAKIWVTDNAFVVKNISEHWHMDFLTYELKYLNLNQYASQTAQPVISNKSMKDVMIMLPPLSEQQSIVSHLDSLSEKVNSLQQNYSRICDECDALKQAILRQVFE